MAVLAEIQKSIAELSGDEKKALSLWLDSQFEPDLSADEERSLLKSLDEAASDMDDDKGVSIETVRRLVSTWASK